MIRRAIAVTIAAAVAAATGLARHAYLSGVLAGRAQVVRELELVERRSRRAAR